MALLTEKHPNVDFFVADIFDQTPFKDDIASMEHPVFTLATKPDLRTIEYRNGNIEIDINPHFKLGLPTIFDKDLLLYSASLLMLEVNAGRTPPRTIRISPHDFFISTNRHADNKIGGNNNNDNFPFKIEKLEKSQRAAQGFIFQNPDIFSAQGWVLLSPW